MLNPNKPYYKTAKFLKDNSISKEELIKQKDPVWKIITSFVPEENIFYNNWTSFSNIRSKTQDGIRMRDDRFLEKARTEKLDNTYVFFSCIKIEKRKVYFVLTSNFFTNYSYSTESGNSFLLFDIHNLFQWAKKSNFIQVKKRKVNGKGLQPIYHYWVGTNVDTNYKSLKDYLNVLSTIHSTNYSVLHRKLDNKNRIAIPDKVIDAINKKYGGLCALLKNKKCQWTTESKKAQMMVKKNLHHIIPEEWFIQRQMRDSKIINDPNNIVLVCQNCHEMVHSENEASRKSTLDSIISMLKESGQFDNFEDYLINKVKITLPILYSIYNCNYEE